MAYLLIALSNGEVALLLGSSINRGCVHTDGARETGQIQIRVVGQVKNVPEYIKTVG